ncbi:MAG: M48 family metalloprotease [Bacteroidetes bacterium]|nr:M48 family metalloprotease [Bacteroidota bacterium]
MVISIYSFSFLRVFAVFRFTPVRLLAMNFKYIISITLLLCVLNSEAQNIPDDFNGLRCEGSIPLDFSKSLEQKIDDGIREIRQSGKLNKKNSRKFSTVINYHNDLLLWSGEVSYGDPITAYAQSIVDRLTKNLNLKKPVRVYLVKSDQVNAMTTDEGIIYLYLGLVARVRNEAELAFVLAHEIGHYVNGHSMQKFSRQQELKSGKSYKHLNFIERILTSLQYDRKDETEADEFGYKLYVEAGYQSKSSVSVMDFLLYSYLPAQEVDLDWNYFETNGFHFPDKYKLKEFKKIEVEEDINDMWYTHPNIKKRKTALGFLMRNDSVGLSNPEFILKDSNEFNYLKKLAAFEIVNCLLRSADYPMALYQIQMLKQSDPKHPFLLKAELMCWYGMQMFINNSQKTVYSKGYKDFEGKQQAIRCLTSSLNRKEMNTYAVKFIWEHANAISDTAFSSSLKFQSMRELAKRSGLKSDFYSRVSESDSVYSTYQTKKPDRYSYCNSAFEKLFTNAEFETVFRTMYGEFTNYQDTADFDAQLALLENTDKDGSYSKYDIREVRNLMMISPIYFGYDNRQAMETMLRKSKEREAEMLNDLKGLTDKNSLEVQLLNNRVTDTINTDKFNEYCEMRMWLDEETLYDGDGFTSFHTAEISELGKLHSTSFLGLNYVYSYTYSKHFRPGLFILSVIALPALPVYLYWQLKPVRQSEYTFLVFDLKSGDVEYLDFMRNKKKCKRKHSKKELKKSIGKLAA